MLLLALLLLTRCAQEPPANCSIQSNLFQVKKMPRMHRHRHRHRHAERSECAMGRIAITVAIDDYASSFRSSPSHWDHRRTSRDGRRVRQLSAEIDSLWERARRKRRAETSEMRRLRDHARRYDRLLRGMGADEMERLTLNYVWRWSISEIDWSAWEPQWRSWYQKTLWYRKIIAPKKIMVRAEQWATRRLWYKKKTIFRNIHKNKWWGYCPRSDLNHLEKSMGFAMHSNIPIRFQINTLSLFPRNALALLGAVCLENELSSKAESKSKGNEVGILKKRKGHSYDSYAFCWICSQFGSWQLEFWH